MKKISFSLFVILSFSLLLSFNFILPPGSVIATPGDADLYDEFDTYNSSKWDIDAIESPNDLYQFGTWQQGETWFFWVNTNGGEATKYVGWDLNHDCQSANSPFDDALAIEFTIETEIYWYANSAFQLHCIWLDLRDAEQNTVIKVGHYDAWAANYGRQYAKIGTHTYYIPESQCSGFAHLQVQRDSTNLVTIKWDDSTFTSAVCSTPIHSIHLEMKGHESTYKGGASGFNFISIENDGEWLQANDDPEIDGAWHSTIDYNHLESQGDWTPETPPNEDWWITYDDLGYNQPRYSGIYRKLDIQGDSNWQVTLGIDFNNLAGGFYSHQGGFFVYLLNQDKKPMMQFSYSDGSGSTEQHWLGICAYYYDETGDPIELMNPGQVDAQQVVGDWTIRKVGSEIQCFWPEADIGTVPGTGEWQELGSTSSLLERGELTYLLVIQRSRYRRPTTALLTSVEFIDGIEFEDLIRNLSDGEILKNGYTIDIIANYTGTQAVTYQIDDGPEECMSQFQSTDRYTTSWTIPSSAGEHTITVRAYDSPIKYQRITVQVVTDWTANIYFEIDYIDRPSGWIPESSDFAYCQNYWKSHGINMEFIISDAIPYDPSLEEINFEEFLELEYYYNDVLYYDDRIDHSGCLFGEHACVFALDSAEKWLLLGTSNSAWGQTIVEISGSGNLLYGNYIDIRYDLINEDELDHGIENQGLLIMTLMHEIGHSIGIGFTYYVTGQGWKEQYTSERITSETFCVMNRPNENNWRVPKFYNHWYYCVEEWATMNLEYY